MLRPIPDRDHVPDSSWIFVEPLRSSQKLVHIMPISLPQLQQSKHPYYIYAPDYRETSAGIVVLHTLCDALNKYGYEAYLVGTGIVSPDLHTPVLTPELLDSHNRSDVVPIVVYPEVISGNPVGAQVCVRYILNTIGQLTGQPLNEGEDDLLFYYSENFIGDKDAGEVDYLFLPVVSPEVFKPNPSKIRDKAFVFQYRFPMEKIDFSRFPAGTELLSMAAPVSLTELAAKLQTGKVLYTYEPSAVCTEAMMCGCPVIYMHEGGLKHAPDRFLFGTNGSAMASERNGLARARATVGVIHPIVAAQMSVFAAQLPYFVERTQEAAHSKSNCKRRISFPGSFTIHRVPKPESARPLMAAVLSIEPAFNACSYGRLTRPFDFLAPDWKLEWAISNNQVNLPMIANADLIIMHRLVPAGFTIDHLKQIFALGVPVVYETDEFLDDLPLHHPIHVASRQAKAGIEYVARHARAIVVSTNRLAERFLQLNPVVHVLPGYIDIEMFRQPIRDNPKIVNIGILATAFQQSNFHVIEEAINELLVRYRGAIQWFVFGKPLHAWSNRPDVTIVEFPQSYQEYAAKLREMKWDIGLAPLANDEFNASRPPMQWLEFSATGAATICSDIPAYCEVLRNGCTGLLTPDSSDAWVDAIACLIDNPQLRRSIARTAQAEVSKQYSLQNNYREYGAAYRQWAKNNRTTLMPRSPDSSPPIPAVLILDAHGNMEQIQRSLQSLGARGEQDDMIVVLTTLKTAVPDWTTDLRYLQATVDEYPTALEQICALGDFDWKIIAEAGTSLASC